jgi:hypothetical protein
VSTRLSAGDAVTRLADAGGPLVTAVKDAVGAIGGAIASMTLGLLSFFASLFGK